MAKVVLNDITNVATSLNDLNYNFTAIENAFADHLSRKPAATNHLETSLDLNSNNIYNVKYLQAEDLRVNGQSFTDNMSTVNSLISTSELIRNETTIIAAQAAASAEEAADIVVELGDQVAQASASASLAYGYKVEAANSFTIAQEQAVAAMGYANTASAAALSASTNAAQTALDVIATTADALQTGIDAASSSASAAAALVSENNAAQSAIDAAASAGALTPVETQILAGASKTTPVDTDEFGIVDTTVLKRLSWANVKATLLIYFNTVYATLAALDLKAPIASPTFTGTVGGITKTMVGLSNVDNTSDVNKPISTATQTALNNKAALAGSASQSFSMLNGTAAGTLGVAGNLTSASLHFTSTSGSTAGGFLMSAAENNFYASSGAEYVTGTGWVQRSSDGYSVMVGSGGLGYSFFTGSGTVVGATVTTVLQMRIDYNGLVTIPGTLSLTGASSTLGYGTGAGGTVTQVTSRTTGVTINKPTGAITLVSAAGSATPASFTVTNSLVEATDSIVVNQVLGTDLYEIHITAIAAGSFRITFKTTGGTTTEQPIFRFSVIKGASV